MLLQMFCICEEPKRDKDHFELLLHAMMVAKGQVYKNTWIWISATMLFKR